MSWTTPSRSHVTLLHGLVVTSTFPENERLVHVLLLVHVGQRGRGTGSVIRFHERLSISEITDVTNILQRRET